MRSSGASPIRSETRALQTLSPELLIAGHVGGTKADMTEAGNPGVAACAVALAGMRGPIDQFNAVTAGILEGNKALDVACCGLAFVPFLNGMANSLQFGCRRLQVLPVANLERDRLIAGLPSK